jgi:pimeloyl-ACP methyl ester carboxylesterase
LLLAAIATAGSGCASVVNTFAFHPTDDGADDLPHFGPKIIEKRFQAADGVPLHAYYLPNSTGDKVVILFHGNHGNSTQRLPQAISLHEVGVSVFLLSYRGYPKSGGSVSEQGVYVDGRAALNIVNAELGYHKENTFLLGRSLGSAVAVDVAQQQPLAGLILVSPISSGNDFARYHGMGWAESLLGDPFDSAGKLQRITSPVLIIHGADDDTLPIQMSHSLFGIAPTGSTFVEVPGAGHNDLLWKSGRCYWLWISGFIHRSDHGPSSATGDDTRCIRGTTK